MQACTSDSPVLNLSATKRFPASTLCIKRHQQTFCSQSRTSSHIHVLMIAVLVNALTCPLAALAGTFTLLYRLTEPSKSATPSKSQMQRKALHEEEANYVQTLTAALRDCEGEAYRLELWLTTPCMELQNARHELDAAQQRLQQAKAALQRHGDVSKPATQVLVHTAVSPKYAPVLMPDGFPITKTCKYSHHTKDTDNMSYTMVDPCLLKACAFVA